MPEHARKPWSDPASDPLADILDMKETWREASRTRDRATELREIEAHTDELLRRAGFVKPEEKIP